MEIKAEGKRIVVTSEERNEGFYWAIRKEYFTGDWGGKVRYMQIAPMGTKYEYKSECESDYITIDTALRLAKINGVKVSAEVIEYRNKLEQRYRELQEIAEAEEKARKAREQWEHRKRFGCGYCENLRRYTDAYYCRKTGEDLETQRRPKFDGMTNTYYLFNREPFPSGNCPLKTDQEEKTK